MKKTAQAAAIAAAMTAAAFGYSAYAKQSATCTLQLAVCQLTGIFGHCSAPACKK